MSNDTRHVKYDVRTAGQNMLVTRTEVKKESIPGGVLKSTRTSSKIEFHKR